MSPTASGARSALRERAPQDCVLAHLHTTSNHVRGQWLRPVWRAGGVACGVKLPTQPIVQTQADVVSGADGIDSIHPNYCDSLMSGELLALHFRRGICSRHLCTAGERDRCDQSNDKSSHWPPVLVVTVAVHRCLLHRLKIADAHQHFGEHLHVERRDRTLPCIPWRCAPCTSCRAWRGRS